MKPSQFQTGSRVTPLAGPHQGATGTIIQLSTQYLLYIEQFVYLYHPEQNLMQRVAPYTPHEQFPADCFTHTNNYHLFPE